MASTPLVFVLIPFDDSFLGVYENLIKEPLETIGFEVRRADSLLNQQNILKDIVKGIAGAALIVADVTGLNENVLYELGMAHALGKRTVMITQVLDELPFDLRAYRVNEYSIHFSEAHKLVDTLTEIGNAVIAGTAEFSNPVQDFAPYALSSTAQVAQTPLSPWSDGTEEEGEQGDTGGGGPSTPPQPNGKSGDDAEIEPGFLELAVETEAAGHTLTEVAERIGALTVDIGAKSEQATERLTEVQARLGDRAMGPALQIAREIAKDYDAFTEALNAEHSALRAALAPLTAFSDVTARTMTITDDEDLDAAKLWVAEQSELDETLGGAYGSTMAFASSLGGMPHVSRDMTKATRRASAAVATTGEILLDAQSALGRARQLVVERIDQYVARQAGVELPPDPSVAD